MDEKIKVNFETNSYLYDVSLDKKFSFKDLKDNYGINTLADNNKKKLVFLISDNSIEFLICYVNFLNDNFLVILLNKRIEQNQIDKLIDIYKPSIICLKDSNKFFFKNYQVNRKILRNIILERKKEGAYKINNLNKLLISTSGTTGSSKFVRLSISNLNYNSLAISNFLNIKKNHVTVTTLPPDYTLGLSVINTHLRKGSSIVLSDYSFLEKKFWNLISNKKITSFTSVPISLDILKKIEFTKFNIDSIKYISQAGGAITNEMHKYMNKSCEKKRIKFYPMYGSTEATARISILDWKFRNKIGSVGKPLLQTKVKLSEDKKSSNRILFRGRNVSLGYAKNLNDLKKGDTNKGQILMDDIGKIDRDGFLFILGKNSRFIKLHGLRINLDEIQDLLSSINFPSKCVFKNNKLMIFILKKKLVNKAEIFIKKNLKINHHHFKVIIIKSFPLNKNKKVDFKKLENYEKQS